MIGLLLIAVGGLIATRPAGSGGEAGRAALLQVAQRTGAVGGDPLTPGGELRFSAFGQAFRISTSDFAKQRPQTYWVGTDVPAAAQDGSAYRVPGRALTTPMQRLPHIVCRSETRFDRFGKRLGLNREPHTGNEAFDRSFYIETSAKKADVDPLIGLASFQAAAGEAAALGGQLVLNAERHAVALRLPLGAEPSSPEAFDRAVQALAALTRDLPPLRDRTLRAVRLHGVGPMLALLAITPIAGAVVFDSTFLHPLDERFDALALKVTAGLFVLGVLVAWLVSRGSPRGLTRFALGLSLVIAASPSVAIAGLALTNRLGDTSSTRVTVPVVGKHYSDSRKSRSYRITVGGWEGHPRGASFGVSAQWYSEFDRGPRERRVELDLGDGRLGYAWLRGYKIAE